MLPPGPQLKILARDLTLLVVFQLQKWRESETDGTRGRQACHPRHPPGAAEPTS